MARTKTRFTPTERTSPVGGLLREKKKKFSDDEATAILFGSINSHGTSARTPLNEQTRLWYLCIAFYLGQQTRTDLSTVALMTDWLEPTRNEFQYVANHIAPLVNRQINRLISADGTYHAVPATPDFRDQRGAKAASNLLAYLHRNTMLRDKRRDVAMWMTLAGMGGLYAEWDDRIGQSRRIYRDPFDPEIIIDAARLSQQEKNMLQSLGSMEEASEGDITTMAVSPFEIEAPNSFSEVDEMPWIRIDKLRSFEWLWDHYPDMAAEVRPETLKGPTQHTFIRRLLGLASGVSMTNDLTQMDNAVLVSEWWRPPSTLMERGALLVGAGGVVLHNGPHPSVERELDIRFPVDVARYQKIPGHWRGMSMVQHLIAPQMEYNRSRTQIIQQRDMLSHAQWSGTVTPERRRNEYGDFWIVPKGEVIQMHQPPALSQAHAETTNRSLYDFQILSAQNEASQGMNPAGVRSGNALAALQERDMETVGPAFEELEGCLERHSTKMLKLCAKLMTTPRAIDIHGKATMIDVIYLKGMDLRGNTKVVLLRGSARPRSQAALQENVGTLLQNAALDPANPEVQRFLFKTYELHGLDMSLRDTDLEERRIEQENEIFANPQVDSMTGAQQPWPNVDKYDNHQHHNQVHRRFRLTDEYENLPLENKMALEAHMFLHDQELAKQMMAAQAMQGPPQGSQPKETGTPSPPKAKAKESA